nr:hypothetical protein [Herbaspirillum sp. B39]
MDAAAVACRNRLAIRGGQPGVIVSGARPLFCFLSQVKFHFICECQSITLIILPLPGQSDEVSDLTDIDFGMTKRGQEIMHEKLFYE